MRGGPRMAHWLVTQGDRQFSVQDLNELKQLARGGRLSPGDMVQPPGASDWLYATELPELSGLFSSTGSAVDDDDLDYRSRKGLPQAPLIAVLLILAGLGGYGMYYYANKIPDAADLALLGEQGLALTEMLVTADPATVRSKPEEGASTVGQLSKDAKIQLIAKRGDFYRVQGEGQEGWVGVKDVVPAYLFADSRVREDYDPIYNPDRYVYVKNSSWMQLPNQRDQNTTLFQFLLQNKSKFEMTDLVLLATIKDKNDRILERAEIPIEGSIAPFSSVEVGTLLPEESPELEGMVEGRKMTTRLFESLSKSDPELALRWASGVEVQMESEGFVEANIDLLELRAIPRELD